MPTSASPASPHAAAGVLQGHHATQAAPPIAVAGACADQGDVGLLGDVEQRFGIAFRFDMETDALLRGLGWPADTRRHDNTREGGRKFPTPEDDPALRFGLTS